MNTPGPQVYDNVALAGNYTESKIGLGGIYPENVIAQPWDDLEPLISPEKLKRQHLWGIPLVSAMINPYTRKPDVLDNDQIKDIITEAAGLGELESKLDFFPKQYLEKHPFDRATYEMFGYFQLRHRPCSSLENLTITPSNETSVYTIPSSWVDLGLLHQGQINLIPLTLAIKNGGATASGGSGGAFFLSVFGNRAWVPSFFEITYTTGFPQGKIPKVVNQYIGVIAAMEILSMLATTYAKSNSANLSIDGLSQGVSMSGPELFGQRMKELGSKRKWLLRKLQSSFNMLIVTDNV